MSKTTTREPAMFKVTFTDYAETNTWTIDRDAVPYIAAFASTFKTYIRCYTCDGTDLSAGLFNSGGCAQCYGCALKYAGEGMEATVILDDAQQAKADQWAAAGIGAN